MRGSKLEGRFSIDYESKRMQEGIAEDLGAMVGVEVDWYQWGEYYFENNYSLVVDDIYDVSNSIATNGGRRWAKPFKMPAVMAQWIRGTNVMNERGFYVTDTLRLVLNVGDVERLIPDILQNASNHIKDRIMYKGELFVPTRVLPRGAYGYRWSVVTIDCNQVNPEELVNDPQFQDFAAPSLAEPRNTEQYLEQAQGFDLGGYGD